MNRTLVIHHLFTALAIVLMGSRLICRKLIFRKFDFGDYCTMAAILCAAARGGMIHVVLTWGTNNISSEVRANMDFTAVEIYRRTIGSKLIIINRPSYNFYLWLQKSALLNFFVRNFLASQQKERYVSWIYGVVFAVSLVAAQIVGFTECDPFHLYWQVVPAPGSCVRAQTQLIVLGVLNIVTDAMLLVLPIPTLASLQTSWRSKIRLFTLCALGTFIITITIIRLPINASHAAVQSNRSIWASTELLAAAIVVNAPILYGSLNLWRQRLRKGTHGSTSRGGESSALRTIGSTARTRHSSKPVRASYDDDQLALRTHCQTSITSEGSCRDPQGQEGIMMKTSVMFHHDSEIALENKSS